MSEELRKIVNASGFVFQVALEEMITFTASEHQWRIESREHGWRDGDTPRFADLVLTRGSNRLVIECKRTKAADWVFLVPDQYDEAKPVRRLRTFYSQAIDHPGGGYSTPFGPADWELLPESWESYFCAVRGTGEDQGSMLDRLCAGLTRSSDRIAAQQLEIQGGRQLWITTPMIVTNAKLHVCRFVPGAIYLEDGVLPDEPPEVATWETVSFIRYRKSFDYPRPTQDMKTLGDLEAITQRTVLVANATEVPHLLKAWDLKQATK